MKKIIKICAAILLCFIVLTVTGIGYLICDGTHPGKSSINSVTTNETETLSAISESEYIDTPACDELPSCDVSLSDIPICLSDTALAALTNAITESTSDFRMADYYAVDDAEIAAICKEIAEVVNDTASDSDRAEIANTLEEVFASLALESEQLQKWPNS